MSSLAMPSAVRQLGRAFDHQNPDIARSTPAESTDMAIQLVAENPDGVHERRVRDCDSGRRIRRVLTDPGVHRYPGGHTDIDRTRRAELGDGANHRRCRARFVG